MTVLLPKASPSPPRQPVPRGSPWVCLACARAAWLLGLGLSAWQAQAQNTGALRIVPSLDVTVSTTDSTYAQAKDSGTDIVTQLRPGLSMSARSGRFRASLDYALNAIHHSRETAGNGQVNSLQNALNSLLSAELVPGRVYVDANAGISQQAISAFGQQTVDGTQTNANRTETQRGSIRPYVRGNVAGLVNYQLTLNADGTHSKDVPTPYTLATGAVLSLSSSSGRSLFGWSASVSDSKNRYSGAKASENLRGSVSVIIAPDPDVTASVRGGKENYGVPGVYRQSYNNWGADLQWTPTPRTQVSLAYDKRYYGYSEQVTLNHSFQNSALRFSSSQGSSESNNNAAPQTLYQVYFNLPQFTQLQPDPILREQLVRAFIKAIGQNPDALVGGGFVNAAATLQRREDLSYSYSGRRGNVSLQAFSSSTRRIVTSNTGVDVDNTAIRQAGATLYGAYRLTPVSNLNLTLSRVHTQATATQAGNDLKSVSLSYNTSINRYTSTSVSARTSKFEGPVNPYRDTSLSASLGLRF